MFRIVPNYQRLFGRLRGAKTVQNVRNLSKLTPRTLDSDDVVEFDSSKRFYKAKKTNEIIRSMTILKLCAYDVLVKNSLSLMAISERLLGEKLFHSIMKKTMYIQFVAGEEYKDIQESVAHLKEHGIGTILCVPTEDDNSEDNPDEFESKEQLLDRNVDLIHDCIDKTVPGAFSQMRISAICSPPLLATLSKLIQPYETEVDKPNGLDVKNLARGFDTETYYLDLVDGLTANQNRHLQNSLRRMDALAKHSREKNVRLLIDAEYSHMEGAMHQIILTLQSRHNNETPWVYGTYQAYRKDTIDRIKADLQLMSREGFHFAAKIVRGAYKDSERKRAKQLGYNDPIHETYENTCESYNKIIEIILDIVASTPAKVMVATHNEESIKLATQRMAELGIDKQSGQVSFAQVYGMYDQVTYLLGSKDFEIYKSVPYGPVKTTIPYLARRALENNDIVMRTKKERGLMWKELGYRMFPFSAK